MSPDAAVVARISRKTTLIAGASGRTGSTMFNLLSKGNEGLKLALLFSAALLECSTANISALPVTDMIVTYSDV